MVVTQMSVRRVGSVAWRPVDLRIFTEPQQGASYDQLLRLARASEDAGFDAFFRSDHYLAMGGDGLPGPTDAWLTLAGLARETSRIRLGTLVTAATFRLPGPLAISVAQVDAMSGGRVELGLGSGWFAEEHTAYGIPFPSLGERFDKLEEQMAIVTGLWATPAGETFSFAGRHYTLTDSPALPKPVQQPGPPVIVGGAGAKRTPALAARYAAEFNMPFASAAAAGEQFGRVREALAAAGRDESSMTWSAAQAVCCGKDDAEVRRRAEAIGRDVDQLRAEAIAGTPTECVERIRQYAEQGATRIYLQTLDVDDLDHIELIASEVAPQLP
jgi:F420-dependent oxidoreductase-like protein